MATFEEAVQQILNHVMVMDTEIRPLLQCLGQVASEDVSSSVTLPMTRISGPDGYAVRSEDIAGAGPETPVVLKILGTSRAGHPSRLTVQPRTAMRIMTGSVVPDGADCVIRFEDTDEPGDKNGPNENEPKAVKIFQAAGPGDNIRPMGGMISKGRLLVSRGTLIGPNQIMALATIGTTHVKVVRRPVIAVITTGDELVTPGSPLAIGQVYDSNGPAIISYIKQYGGIPSYRGIARDNETSLKDRLDRLEGIDAVITSGGVSKGDFDLVRLILSRRGNIIFSRVQMGPGASVTFATMERAENDGQNGSIPIFALAGPPMGCLVNLETLVRPALLKMRGVTGLDHPAMEATLEKSVSSRIPFPFARWSQLEKRDGAYSVNLNTSTIFDDLETIAKANSLFIVPNGGRFESGDCVKVLPLSGLSV